MPQQLKTAGIALLVALTALGAGYLWGARGRWAAEERLGVVERQASLSEARRLVLAGQVALTALNFGEAAGSFESARAAADASIALMEKAGQPELAADLKAAGALLDQARTLAARLDRGAFGKAGEALTLLNRTADRDRTPPVG